MTRWQRSWVVLAGMACAHCDIHLPGLDLPCAHLEVRIVELMPNPQGVDAQHEWLELQFSEAIRSANLQALSLHIDSAKRQRRIALHSHSLVGSEPVELILVVDSPQLLLAERAAVWLLPEKNLQMPNSEGTVSLYCGERRLSSVHYGGQQDVPTPPRGISLQFDGQRWCFSTDSNDANRPTSTPGMRNPLCPSATTY